MNIPTSKTSVTVLLMSLAMLALGTAVQAQTPVPAFSKAFTPATIGPGSVSTLRFDIANGTGLLVTNMAFSDTLPAGVTIADPAVVSSTCGGTVSAASGDDTITFSDGGVGVGGSCFVRVNVTSATPGTHTNTSGALTSSAGNSGTATADLVVATDRPGFSKSFDPDTVTFGNRSRLTFTIDNTANGAAAVNLTFIDNLPPGMVIASPANRSKTCTGGTFSAPAGGSVVSYGPPFAVLNDASVGAGASCTLSVDVLANAVGSLGNTSGELTSTLPNNSTTRSSGKAGATLTVLAERVALIKSFTDDPVPPGGTVTLQFTLRNLDRAFQATDIEFSDDLDAVVAGLAPAEPLPKPACGGTVDFAAPDLTLTGATLDVGGSCTFSVTLQVPASAPSGSFINTTSTVTANVDGSPVGGSAASDLLFIEPAPILTKEFTDDPVGAGDSVTLEFTITNTSASSDATDITFSDEFVVELPTASSVPADGFCGAGSTADYTPLIDSGTGSIPALLVVSGASLGPGASCTFSLTLDVAVGSAAGLYPNTTSDISATVDSATVTGNPASDDLEIVGAPALTKEFTDDPATPGGTVTLQFTISHDESAPADANDITFSDDLDATLSGLVATGLPASDVCGAGSEISGTMTMLFTGGTLAPGETCTFSVTLQVPSDAPAGAHTNTTSAIQATVLGAIATGLPAQSDLRIAGLVLTKEFTDDPVLPGGVVNLNFTIENVTSASTATDIQFSDDLDDVLSGLAATGLPQNDVCGTGSTLSGTSTVALSGGSLDPGTFCTFGVSVQVPAGAVPDTYRNRTSGFRGTLEGVPTNFDNAQDDLVVAADFLALAKEFTDDPATPGGTVNLRFTLTNLDPVQTADNLAFTDDLDAALSGLVATGLPIAACGGNVSGTSTISLAGGSLVGGASCTFDVTLTVPSAVALGTVAVNLTSQATGTIGGLAVLGDPATDELLINVLNFVKSFDADANAGGSVGLSFTIENLSSSEGISDLSFVDDLDAVIPGLVATGLPTADVCGAGSLLTGTSVLTLTGGNLLPSGSCTFSVTLSVPGDAEPGDYLNTTSSLRTSTQGEVANGASATLTVIAVDDADGDGVLDNADVCPDTVIPEGVPTQRLGVNRHALVDEDLIFDTTPPPGGGNGPGDVFTTTDTAGCSCEQIIDALGLGEGHRKFGCSVGVMREWVRQVTPVFVSGFESG